MDRPAAFKEFTPVSLRRDVFKEGVRMPRGAHGVIMAAYADGRAYEVEFEEPKHVVLTMEEEDLVA